MPKDVRVLVLEDDPYARDFMVMLLSRDWRTRVIEDLNNSLGELRQALTGHHRIDVIVVDTEVPDDPELPFHMIALIQEQKPEARILCTATHANQGMLRRLLVAGVDGYILKQEIRYGLAAAVAAVQTGQWAATPTTYQMAGESSLALPDGVHVFEHSAKDAHLTPREKQVGRLAVLFNLSQRDLSDELQIRQDEVGKITSRFYRKTGIDDLFQGDIAPEEYFRSKLVLKRFQAVQEQLAGGSSRRKVPDMATFVFHIMTTPQIWSSD